TDALFSLHRFNRCLTPCGLVCASSLEQPPTITLTATGASDDWRMNRRHSIGSSGATAWSLALAASLDLPPAVAPTPIGYSDDPVAILPVPSIDHVFNSSKS